MKEALWRKVESMKPIERAVFFGVEPSIIHTRLWIQVRDSFHSSREWRDFTKDMKTNIKTCSLCQREITPKTKSDVTGNTGHVCFQVHHKEGYQLDKRVIDYGFLFDLQDKSKFGVICSDCHFTGHSELIEEEKSTAGREKL